MSTTAEIIFFIIALIWIIYCTIDCFMRHPESDDDNITDEYWYEDYDMEDEFIVDESDLEFVDDGGIHDIINVPGHQDLYYSKTNLLVYKIIPGSENDENEYLEGFFFNDMYCIYIDGKVCTVDDNGNIVAIVHPAVLPK